MPLLAVSLGWSLECINKKDRGLTKSNEISLTRDELYEKFKALDKRKNASQKNSEPREDRRKGQRQDNKNERPGQLGYDVDQIAQKPSLGKPWGPDLSAMQ